MKTGAAQLRNNTISLLIIQFVNYLLPFLTLPYISRIFSVEKIGLIFFAQVVIDYFGRIMTFGFDMSGTRIIAINSDNQEKVNSDFNTIMGVQFVFLIAGYIILSIITVFIPKFRADWLIYHLTYFSLFGQYLLFTWLYQGMQQMKFITVLNIIQGVAFLSLVFLFIKKPDDYILYPLFSSFACIISGLISLFFAQKHFKIKFQIPKIKSLWKMAKYSSQFFITKIAIALYRQTNALIIGFVCTYTLTAYYVAADKMFWAVLSLYFTFINALFPFMSKNKDIVFFKKMLKYLVAFSVLTSIILFISSKYIVLIIFSEQYLEAAKILQIFSLSFIFYIFLDTLGMPLLGAFGYIKETNFAYIGGGIYNLLGLLCLYLTNHINILSVAILVSSTYFVMFLHRIYYVHKYKILEMNQGDTTQNN